MQTISWGLDVYTCWNIINSLPSNLDDWVAYDFIMNKVQTSQLLLGPKGYDMKRGMKFIIEDKNGIFNAIDKEFAWVILDYFTADPESCWLKFKVHSKGLGVVCKWKEGI